MSERLYAATRKGLFTLERRSSAAGAAWRVAAVAFLGDEVTNVLPEPATGRLFAALRLGHFGVKVHRSEDGGARWEECAAPAYPRAPRAEEGRRRGRADVPWSVVQLWALEAAPPAAPGEPGTLWAGDLPGGLFRSADAGESWSLVRALWDRPERREWFGGGYRFPGIHTIAVDPRDPRRLLVAVSVGGVWATADGGESWETRTRGMSASYVPPDLAEEPNVQDPHRLVQCRAVPDALWCQHHAGVFRSTDCAATWREVPAVRPSTYGFAAAVHPRDPAVAWLVPAASDACRLPVGGRLVVARTRDGGESFELLARGLPQEHAYHLVLRHGLAVDASGDRLAFGTNLGGLWTSDDGGDGWTRLAADLPVVNCVRFGEA